MRIRSLLEFYRSVIFLAIGPICLFGCGASSKQYVRMGDISPNYSTIYVMKTEKFQGGGVVLYVCDGPVLIGELGPNDYLHWSRPPGLTRLYAYYPGNRLVIPVPVMIDAKPNKSHYASIETVLPIFGTGQRVILQEINESDAKELMSSRKPAVQEANAKPFDEAIVDAGKCPGKNLGSALEFEKLK